MKSRRIEIFADRYPLVGPIVWLLSVQYFVAQIVAAHAWTTPFHLRVNAISDLGNTVCGRYGDKFVCSPLHALMNASFITLGLTMIIGAIVLYHEFITSPGTAAGFSGLALAGVGAIVVGCFPENTINLVHVLGAGLVFLVGNLGITVLGFALDLPRLLKRYTIMTGIITLIALILLLVHVYLGLGYGGMERLTAYPQTLWLIIFGFYISNNRFRQGDMMRRQPHF